MKKTIFASFIILAAVIFCHAQTERTGLRSENKIDRIKTADEVEKLLESIDKQRYEAFKVNETFDSKEPGCRELAERAGVKPWTKADFDNNGATDILVHGRYDPKVIVIMDKGKNNFEVRYLSRRAFQECAFAAVENRGSETIVNYKSLNEDEKDKKLIYKFGGFVELNEAPKTYQIEKIKFRTGICFGSCPAFELTIDADRKASYDAIAYNDRKGKFKGTIEKANFDELINALNYADFPNLKDDYEVPWTDDQASTLTITYNGGKTKKITDYGLIGTFSLSRIYAILFDLRENQSWKQ